MARSWRNFFRRTKSPEEAPGPEIAPEEPPEAELEEPLDQVSDPDTGPDNAQLETEPVVSGGDEELVGSGEVEEIEEVVGADAQEETAEAGEEAEFEPDFSPEDPEETGELASRESGGWFSRLRGGLKRSRDSMVGQLNAAISEFRDVEDEEFWERVEEILISSDVGIKTTARLVAELEQEALEKNITSSEQLRKLMVEHATRMLEGPVELDVSFKPTVLLMVGVNGTGKTTTIGKLVNYLPGEVVLAAGDTFRAAAIEQLQTWGERTGAPVIARQRGADAAAVAHEAVDAAKRDGKDVLLIDTAGRLHTKINLMAELEKVRRVIERQIPDAPHEVLMTVDATTGQNGLRQVEMFKDVVGVTGIILTKLDGTAKGGIALAIANETGLPIKLISVGEKVGDLHPFDAKEFSQALFGDL